VIKSRRIKCSCFWEKRNAFSVVVGKAKRKILLEVPVHKWKDNTKMDLLEICCEVMEWIHVA
jgi:hypothetical protein